MARGLNGETVLDREDVLVGTVSGEEYGYKRNLRVTVSVRMEELGRQEEYETTDHRKVSRPLDFSITAAVWRPDRRDIVMSTPGDGIKQLLDATNPQHAELIALSKYHLNGMRAGCIHQTAVYRDGRYGREVDLDATPPCPITGYKYGSAWLLEELPEGFRQRVEAALPPF